MTDIEKIIQELQAIRGKLDALKVESAEDETSVYWALDNIVEAIENLKEVVTI